MMFAKRLLPTSVILKIVVALFQSGVLANGHTVHEVRWKAVRDEKLPSTLQSYATSIRTSIRATMPFPWDVLESSYSGEIPVMEIVKYELPVLIPAAIGILGGLLVLIVTPCYLCCHYCGCCGTKLQLVRIQQQKRWCMYVTGLFVLCCICFIWFTAFGTYQSGQKFQKSPRIALDIVNSSLDDLPAFVSKFGVDLYILVENELNDKLNATRIRVQDLPRILAAPLTDIAENAMTVVYTSIDTLQDGIDNITVIKTEINETVSNIVTWSESLQKVTNDVNDNLTAIKNQCVTDGESFCYLLLEPSTNTPEFNTTKLLDLLSSVKELVSEVNSVNLTEIRSLGNESLTSLPETIDNSSKTAVQDVLDELDKIPDRVLPELDSALEFTNMTRSTFGLDPTIDYFGTMVDGYESLTTPVVDKIVVPTISGVMTFIATLAFLGLLLGFILSRCGSTMASRSLASHAGSVCLMCNVTIAVLPVVLFLLISSVLLVVGSNITIICSPIQDLTFMEKLENGYLGLYSADSIADMLHINISIKYFFETCRGDGTIYTGLNLAEKFNLSSYINTSSFVPELGLDVYNSINETIRDMNVLDTVLLDNMTSSFLFTNITDANNTQSIKEELRDIDLNEWASNLTKVASQLPKQSYVNSYTALARILTNLNENEKTSLLQAVDEMDNITVRLLNLAEKLKNSSSTVSDELENLQQFIQDQATDSVFQTIDDFLNDMAEVPVDFIDSLTRQMANNVGQCGLLWDIYDSITGSLCNYLLDALNVFWLCLYVGGFAMVILMISSCVIVKYFRKPKDVFGQRMYGNMSGKAKLSGSNSQVKTEMYEMSNDKTSPKRGLPDMYYRVVKRKQQKRRRRCFTGCQSPELIKLRLLSENLGNTYESTTVNIDNCLNDRFAICNEKSPFEADICKDMDLCPSVDSLQQNLGSKGAALSDDDGCLTSQLYTEESKVYQNQTVSNTGQDTAEKVLSAENIIVMSPDELLDNRSIVHAQDKSKPTIDHSVEEDESEILVSVDENAGSCKEQTTLLATPISGDFHQGNKGNHLTIYDNNKHDYTQKSEFKQDESVLDADCVSINEIINNKDVTSSVKALSNCPSIDALDCPDKDKNICTNIATKEQDITFHYLEELTDDRIQCALCKHKDRTAKHRLSEQDTGDVLVLTTPSDTSTPSDVSQGGIVKHRMHGKKNITNNIFTDIFIEKKESLCTPHKFPFSGIKHSQSNSSVSSYKVLEKDQEELGDQNVKKDTLISNVKKSTPNSLTEALIEFDNIYSHLGPWDKSRISPTDEDANSRTRVAENHISHSQPEHANIRHKKMLNIQVKPYKDFYKDEDNLGRLSQSDLNQNTALPSNTQKVPTAQSSELVEILKKDYCIPESESSLILSNSKIESVTSIPDLNKKIPSEIDKVNNIDPLETVDGKKDSESVWTEGGQVGQAEMKLSKLAAKAVPRIPGSKRGSKQLGFMAASCRNGLDKTTYL